LADLLKKETRKKRPLVLGADKVFVFDGLDAQCKY
jgi:hypothetical protein